jgi:hypothetical protein
VALLDFGTCGLLYGFGDYRYPQRNLISVIQRADTQGASVAALNFISRLIGKDQFEKYYHFLWQSFEGNEYAKKDLQERFEQNASG